MGIAGNTGTRYVCSLPVLFYYRTNIVLRGPAGRSSRNGGVKPFVNLPIEQLRVECRARALDDEGNRRRKKGLKSRLEE